MTISSGAIISAADLNTIKADGLTKQNYYTRHSLTCDFAGCSQTDIAAVLPAKCVVKFTPTKDIVLKGLVVTTAADGLASSPSSIGITLVTAGQGTIFGPVFPVVANLTSTRTAYSTEFTTNNYIVVGGGDTLEVRFTSAGFSAAELKKCHVCLHYELWWSK